MPSVDVRHVVDATDVRVGELPRDAHFGEEALAPDGVGRHVARQELERDGLPQLHVVSAIDLAHPAAPEQADDPVAAGEHGPGREPTNGNRFGRGQAVHATREPSGAW